MRHMKWISVVLVFVLLLAVAPHPGNTDFGDFGGDDDYGGSWDSGSSWDDDDDDWGSSWGSSSSGSSGGSGGGGSGGGGGSLLGAIIIFIIVVLVIRNKNKKEAANTKKKQGPPPPGAMPTTGLQPISDLQSWDPAFSAADVTQRLSNLYVQMQNCWSAKDITPLRGDFTDQQFAQYDRQLQRYRSEGRTTIFDRITVLGVELQGVKRNEQHEFLVAKLRTRIVSYIVDDKTGAVVSGSKTAEKFMEYEWTLLRNRGKQTVAKTADEALNCPNCGAPLNINHSAMCEYCHTVITRADYDWVISDIKGLSQRTSG